MISTKKVIIFAGLSGAIALLTFLIIPYLVVTKTWGWEYGANTGAIGDTIGGITGPMIGFIGVFLTFLAFYIQYQANQVQISALEEQKKSGQQQEKQIILQQFESNYFELLKIHRENVRELIYRGNEGRNVITKMVNELFEIMQVIIDDNVIRENKLDEQDLANISFTILFFGTDETVTDVLENRFFNKYSRIYDSILLIVNRLRKLNNPYSSIEYYFSGHQSRMGHYFRHLRRSILFVHRNETLTENQKKDYVRTLRAQLSNHEQILLFFFSISDLGVKWELESTNNEPLITYYSLIRNIPLGSIYGYRPNRYYPFLKLEHDFEIRL